MKEQDLKKCQPALKYQRSKISQTLNWVWFTVKFASKSVCIRSLCTFKNRSYLYSRTCFYRLLCVSTVRVSTSQYQCQGRHRALSRKRDTGSGKGATCSIAHTYLPFSSFLASNKIKNKREKKSHSSKQAVSSISSA